MRQAGIIMVALLMLCFQWKDSVVYLSFSVNQGQIAKELCVNRFTPELMCSGSCYLVEQLAEQHESPEGTSLPAPAQLTLFSVFLPSATFMPTFQWRTDLKKDSFFYRELIPKPSLQSIFRPPRLA